MVAPQYRVFPSLRESLILRRECKGRGLQRLFSTFADGWPGIGLLLLRVITTAWLIRCLLAALREAHQFAPISQIIAVAAGVLLLIGLWTPVAGTMLAIVETWTAFSQLGDPWIPVMLAALGATLAMIGPGIWSLDARLFGRKRIEIADR